MKIPAVLLTCGLATVVYALEGNFSTGLPDGWKLGGEAPKLYSAGVDSTDSPSGAGSVVLRRTETSHAYGSATLTKIIAGRDYAGKRVNVAIRVRFDGLERNEGWVFIGYPGREQVSDRSRAIGWNWFQSTMDVPAHAGDLAVGVQLKGPGSAKVDGFEVRVVGDAPAKPKDTNVPGFRPCGQDCSASGGKK